ncbi:proton/sodium-glutamate symport protein [Lysinibacillus sphaericus OT4b.31]|uniref:Proton/sodium-glutamate symport protein n=1 Tax=Lysinibacillus sphaericus OT4b.31 TaxID=1285586 RepID=R7Z7W3_LYSSH|nr:proton/sodium-glutamate symport protein [Lysinibacillus sphaericus OT4b.31]
MCFIISTLIVGVAGTGDMKQLGRLGEKSIIYFEIIITVAIVVGLLSENIFQPGAGVNMNELSQGDISKYVTTTEEVQHEGPFDIIVEIVPTNIIQSMGEGDMLAIIFFSVILGLEVAAIGERGKRVLDFFQGVADAMFWVTNLVIEFAPLGVFGLIGVTVSKYGFTSLKPLALLVYATMLFFIFVVLALVAKFVGVSIFFLIKVLKDGLILAFSTASSGTVLPQIMLKMEKLGDSKDIVSFVIPTGYSFYLDGSTLYQAIAAS